MKLVIRDLAARAFERVLETPSGFPFCDPPRPAAARSVPRTVSGLLRHAHRADAEAATEAEIDVDSLDERLAAECAAANATS